MVIEVRLAVIGVSPGWGRSSVPMPIINVLAVRLAQRRIIPALDAVDVETLMAAQLTEVARRKADGEREAAQARISMEQEIQTAEIARMKTVQEAEIARAGLEAELVERMGLPPQ